MRKIREVLRLRHELGLSYQVISRSCRASVGSVHDYLRRAESVGLTWPLPDDLTDSALEARLFPAAATLPAGRQPVPDWRHVKKELARKGVTLMLRWEEYRASHPHGNGYSHFCELFARWAKHADPRIPIRR